MTDYEVLLRGNDGKTYYATLEWMKQKLEVCNLKSQINSLKRRIHDLEMPGRQAAILRLLKDEGFRSDVWIRNRVWDFDPRDLSELVELGILVRKRSGSHIMYGLLENEQ